MRDELARFKTAEVPESAVMIADDQDAKKVVIAWQFCPIEITREPGDLGELSVNERWDALWDCISFDRDAFAARAGVNRLVLNQKLEMVRSSRLIYPDGTVSRVARAIISGDLVRQYSKKKPK